MKIEKILNINTTDKDKISMILSNNIDIVHFGKTAISINKFEKVVSELLAWHKNELKNDCNLKRDYEYCKIWVKNNCECKGCKHFDTNAVSPAKRKACRCYEVLPKKDYDKCDTCGKAYEVI